MNKRIFLVASALFLALTLSAQNYTGGVKGTVVSRLSKATIDGADLILYSEAKGSRPCEVPDRTERSGSVI